MEIFSSYILTKFIFMINLFGQFFMTNKFLGQNDSKWGVRMLNDLVSGNNWEETGNFPRIALCDFQVRILGNLQRYSIQCVLVMNLWVLNRNFWNLVLDSTRRSSSFSIGGSQSFYAFQLWTLINWSKTFGRSSLELSSSESKLSIGIYQWRPTLRFLQSTAQMSLNEKLHENRNASFRELLQDFVENRINPDTIMVSLNFCRRSFKLSPGLENDQRTH